MTSIVSSDFPIDPGAGEAGRETDRPANKKSRGGLWRRLILIGLAVAGIAALVWAVGAADWLKAALRWLGSLGPWAAVMFVGVYVLLSVVALPTSLLNIGAGLLFGAWKGFAVSLVAATVSNVICFLVSRYLARGWIQRRLMCKPKYAAMLRGLHKETWKVVLLTRLNPLLPSAVAAYCFGVTPVRFRTYLWASIVGNAPLCFLMAYAGSVGHHAFSPGAEHNWVDYVLWGLGILSTIALTIWISRYTSRKLRQYAEEEEAAGNAARASGTADTVSA
jgi:uncharacterized membrane protein YdjX (TVP38/TMEM64 family)